MRSIFVFLHRWAGLAMAAFLILVGITGSILVFLPELNHWLTPNLYPGPRAGVELSAAALARHAEEILPQARATRIFFAAPGTAIASLEARPGTPPIDVALYLDPVTGGELGRVKQSGLPGRVDDLLSFIDRLHWSLALGPWGVWLLGVVALVWTIDCFIAFYLTFPANFLKSGRRFFVRWKPSWLVKRSASPYRFNFDLHRASGLWFFPLLLIFAWTGVCFDLNVVYRGAMGLVLDFAPSLWSRQNPAGDGREPLAWEEAERIARDLMEARAASEGFTIDRLVAFGFDREIGLYAYGVHSSRDVGEKYGGTTVAIDAYTGAFHGFQAPTGGKGGDTATTWLLELHMANVFGLPYRLLVFVAGIAIAILTVTGIVIWLRKRRAGRLHVERRAPASQPAE
jgi:uncharacterized iron-regulated membrane protein